MSDHDTWNMFAAASYAAWLAGGDYAAEECRNRAVADADWFVIESKKRAAPAPTPPQPDDDGWIKWEGGECPVPPLTVVQVQLRDGIKLLDHAENLSWAHFPGAGDVVSFRIVSKAGATK